MLKILAFVGLLLISSISYAEDANPKFFKDWLTLSDLLRTKGIDPNSPSWATITPMCLPLRTSEDQVAYNRCLYEKAMDEYDFGYDNKRCAEKSEAKYPDSLLEVKGRSYSVVDSSGKVKLIEEKYREFNSWSELKKAREASFDDCMEQHDWRNNSTWTSGRRRE